MAEAAEATVRDDVESKEAKDEHGQKQRNTNHEQDPLPGCIPLAKGDVWHKDDGSWHSKQQSSCMMDKKSKSLSLCTQ